MDGKEIGKTDDKHDGRILHVDDIVVSDLRHDIPQRLRQNNVQHGLPVVHTDRFCAFKLALVNAHDTAAHRFRHIGTCIDRYHNNADSPDIIEGDIEEIWHAVEYEHCLQNHGRPAEYLHIGADNNPDQSKEHALDNGVFGIDGNGLENTAKETDDASDKRG